jgi:hypothetical protein
MELPEKFSAIGLGTNRSSHIQSPQKFRVAPSRYLEH